MQACAQWWLLVCEPGRFFERHRAGPANWRAGAAAPVACAVLSLGFGVAMAARLEPLVLGAVGDVGVPRFLLSSVMYGSAVAGALALPLLWLTSAGFLVSVDALFVGRIDAMKQLELAGRAFVSQLPSLVALFVAALSLDEETLRQVDLTAAEGPRRLKAHLARTLWFSVATALSQISQLWLCALLAISYRCLARIRVAAAAGLAVALYAVFFLAPLVSRLLG